MRTLECPECGKEFLAYEPRRKYCSEACTAAVKRRRGRDAHSERMRSPEETCSYEGGCDRPVVHRTLRLCGGHTRQHNLGQPLRPLKFRRGAGRSRKPSLPREEKCLYCGVTFVITERRQGRRKYCSPEHAEQAHLDYSREYQRANWRDRPECEFEGCPNPIAGGTLCAGHYAQQRAGKPLTPLKYKPGKPWYTPPEPCLFRGCEDPYFSKGLCMGHDGQRRNTSLDTETFVAGYLRQGGLCAYCREPLTGGFETDHAHDGGCADIHADRHMCPVCIRGFIHSACNKELIGLERAIRTGRVVQPAPLVAAYLQGRPFLEWCA
jgi:hypothetical protein